MEDEQRSAEEEVEVELERARRWNDIPEETPPQLEELAVKAVELRLLVEQAEKELSEIKRKYGEARDAILATLDAMQLHSFKGHGYSFFRKTTNSIAGPATQEDKQALFKFLEDKGIFWDYASVHSKSLNKLYNVYADEAAKNGILEFRMPGVGEPSSYTSLEMRRTK